MAVQNYVLALSNPETQRWVNDLFKLLQLMSTKESLSQDELQLVDLVFKIVSRGSGERDRLYFALDRLAGR